MSVQFCDPERDSVRYVCRFSMCVGAGVVRNLREYIEHMGLPFSGSLCSGSP